MAQDNTERNLNDLMAAAQKKLHEQGQEAEVYSSDGNVDIYADMRDEMDEDLGPANYPDTKIQYSPDGEPNAPEIKHSPEDYEQEPDFYMDTHDTPIFEGGPGVSQIDLWKKKFSKESVFHTQILDRHFVFRTLNRFEYKQIVSVENVDALYREEMICRTCVLWPYNYDFKQMAVEDSGYPSTLAEIIMENSGFTKEYGIEVL